MELTSEYTHDVKHRFKYLRWIIASVFLIVVGRLYYLQIVEGSYYRFFSEQNSIKEIKVPALRGMIFDRQGKAIVDNRPTFDLVVIPQYLQNKSKVVASLSDILKLDVNDIESRLEKGRGMPSYYPVVIKSDITLEEVSTIRAYRTLWYDESDQYDLRSVEVQMRYARAYSDGNLASHLLGYLREIDPDRLKKYSEKFPNRYQLGDFIGIGGVEEMWDNLLRGADGYDQHIVNAMGRQVEWQDIDLIHEDPKNGASLYLTIDTELQRVAEDELKDKSGAVVAMDPQTGAILALYSSPSFDLNKLSSADGSKYWQEISLDPRRIVYNRALQGTYPPGSTFKIVTATTGLETGEINPKSTIFCGGGINYGGRFYKCWRNGGHGSIAVMDAITASCDTFFYQLGLRVGVDKIAKYANLLGLGHITGIDLPNEKTGLIPTSEWKEKTYKVPWQAGENLSIAIGQGYDTVTPLQNAMMIATIANGGRKVTPHVVSSVVDAEGNEIYRWRESGAQTQQISPQNVEIVKKGLEGVVDSPSGTAHSLSLFGLKIAGKTGTAQVIAKETWRAGVTELKDHAWFVGYAPYDNPKIAVATIVEHGGFGASASAPIVGKVIKKYLENK